jgi:hypothetical protein
MKVDIHVRKRGQIMNYSETKKKIDSIREEYGCKGEIIFRSAIQCVIECGQQTFQDPIWVKQQLDNIDVNHDEADKEGKILFISRDFEKAVLECARELAQIDTHDFLAYIQKEVWLGDNGINYQRAIQLIKYCIDWFTSGAEISDVYSELISGVGFDNVELEELGYSYLLDVIEED